MMDRGTVRNMQSFISKINLRKSVHLVGFIVRKSVTMHGHMNVKKYLLTGLYPGRFICGKQPPVPNEWEMKWASEIAWTFFGDEKNLFFLKLIVGGTKC
jgi:hypothetical protein